MSQFKGKCHCGQVAFTVELSPEKQNHVICHCNTCKVLGGGRYSMNQMIPKSQLTFTQGEHKLKSYTYTGDSGKPVNSYFCTNCGTNIYLGLPFLGEPPKIAIRTTTIEGNKEMPLGVELYCKDRCSFQPEIGKSFDMLRTR